MISMAFFLATLAADATTAAADVSLVPKGRVVCRTFEVTGSLARTKRICKTAKEWDEAARASRDSAERLQNDSRIAPGGDPRGG